MSKINGTRLFDVEDDAQARGDSAEPESTRLRGVPCVHSSSSRVGACASEMQQLKIFAAISRFLRTRTHDARTLTEASTSQASASREVPAAVSHHATEQEQTSSLSMT